MKTLIWMGTLLLAGAGALAAQQASQGEYQGMSNPPSDDTITTTAQQAQEPAAKPVPGRLMSDQRAAPAQSAPVTQQSGAAPAQVAASDGTDDGIVMLAPENSTAPALARRDAARDPDGDIVHPAPLPPGTLGYGTTIRARLLERLSTAYSAEGEKFRATVASDVVQDGQVLIPAGSEIDGTVADVSTGHFAGHGSMILRPQTVTLPNGSAYRLYAQIAGTPGANARVGGEGEITPGSRARKNELEYGGGVGVGMIAGGAVGGPAGVLAGSLVGAGAVTMHLMMDHPQATLKEGTMLIFSLTQPLHLESAVAAQSSNDQPNSQQPSLQ